MVGPVTVPNSTPGRRSQIGAVATPEVGGTRVARHALDVETERLMNLARRVGRRLRFWMGTMPDQRVAMRFDRETNTHSPVLDRYQDKDGQWQTRPVMEPLLPDRDFMENAEWYTKTILGLLKEQRERAKFATGGKGSLPIDDDAFEAELAELARAHVLELSDADLAKLLAERAIDVPSAVATPSPTTSDDDEI